MTELPDGAIEAAERGLVNRFRPAPLTDDEWLLIKRRLGRTASWPIAEVAVTAAYPLIAGRVRAEALREVAQGLVPNHTRPSNWIVVGAHMTDDVLDAVRMVENALAAAVRAEAVADAAKLLSEKFLAERDRNPAEFVLILARRRNPDYDAGYRMAMEDAARYARAAPKLIAAGSVPVATPPRPEIVVLCGSTRFKDAFREAAKANALAGRIVLTVSDLDPRPEMRHVNVPIDADTKQRLDELHKRKIDLADRVLVLNVGGYIGDSTRSEIEYATAHGKPISYLEPTCTCPWTDPSTWTYYCGATEPGSGREFEPECLQHGQSAGPVANPTEPAGPSAT